MRRLKVARAPEVNLKSLKSSDLRLIFVANVCSFFQFSRFRTVANLFNTESGGHY